MFVPGAGAVVVETGAVEAIEKPETFDDEDSADEENVRSLEEVERNHALDGGMVHPDPLWRKVKEKVEEEGDVQWRNNVGSILVCPGFCTFDTEVYACDNGGVRCEDAIPLRVVVLGIACPEPDCGWDRVASSRAHYRHLGGHGWSAQLRADLLGY